jgi:tRNA G18 (ribose-2'-O)-methylase SpoU
LVGAESLNVTVAAGIVLHAWAAGAVAVRLTP